MAGETILARVRDEDVPSQSRVMVGWVLSAPIVSSVDGISYQAGTDSVAISFAIDSSQTIQKKIREGVAARVQEVTGQAFTSADVRGFQAVRTGKVTIGALDTNKDVVFADSMPSALYKVAIFPRGLALAMNITNQSTTGFRFTFAVGNVGDIDYIAVED